ncbi:MAG TPA: DUF1573 domain-containing protein [Candidatus Paceibacterota bacterium]
MNNKIVVVILIGLGIFGLIWWGRASQVSSSDGVRSGGASALAAAETFYDFGTISMKNGLVEKLFTITNPTNQDVRIESVTTSCMCTNAYIVNGASRRGPFGMLGHGGSVPKANELIKAGETRQIAVVYDPNAHGPAGVGQIDRFVYLTEPDGATVQLEIKANVTP